MSLSCDRRQRASSGRPSRAAPLAVTMLLTLGAVSILVTTPAAAETPAVKSGRSAGPVGAGPWKLVGTTDGVTVHLRSLPNYHLPQMRGRVVIPASVKQIFAVLADTDRHPQWMAKTSGARLVKTLKGYNRIIWTRKRTPWPAQDRDAVLRVTVQQDPAKGWLRSTFRVIRTPLAPKLSGVTRMPSLDGYFDLRALGPKRTRVTYVLKADMGGWIPDWLTRLISKKLPLRDLQGLRRQVARRQVARRQGAAGQGTGHQAESSAR